MKSSNEQDRQDHREARDQKHYLRLEMIRAAVDVVEVLAVMKEESLTPIGRDLFRSSCEFLNQQFKLSGPSEVPVGK